jgi:hypothetical protein
MGIGYEELDRERHVPVALKVLPRVDPRGWLIAPAVLAASLWCASESTVRVVCVRPQLHRPRRGSFRNRRGTIDGIQATIGSDQTTC